MRSIARTKTQMLDISKNNERDALVKRIVKPARQLRTLARANMFAETALFSKILTKIIFVFEAKSARNAITLHTLRQLH